MISELRISSLGVIESSELELGPGLTVITGETGAGKTMVVSALGLLMGGRADSGAVRAGETQARVEGIVDVGDLPGVTELVEEHGGVLEDGQVLLARNIWAEGRSRAWVGGAGVPAAVLAALADSLVAVHGQSDQHRLLQPQAQRHALDRYGGAPIAKARQRWDRLYRDLIACERELTEVTTSARDRAREADQLRYGLTEIEQVDPQPGEDVALAQEESRLGFADTLREAAERARETLSSELDGPDAVGAIAAARQALESVSGHDTAAGELAARAAEVSYLLTDLAGDVASYAAGLDSDPARLAAVSERRSALTALTRKYGETIDEVLAWAEKASTRLLDLDATDDTIDKLLGQRTELRRLLAEAGEELSRARGRAAKKLSAAVTAELSMLAMPHARVELVVSQRELRLTEPPSSATHEGGRELGRADAPLEVGARSLAWFAHGLDEVEFLLSANTGSQPRPLSKGASGGELSRVMLALEVSLAGTNEVPTFVFDEVDAGVGGKAAIEVGRRLALLARSAQVLVVTHLPQVAAFADHHVVVSKASDGAVTTSGLTKLGSAERELELSRMLAGLDDSESARAHARELLEIAEAERTTR